MKAKELKKLSLEELKTKKAELKQEGFKLRFELARGQLTNTSKIKSVKREIARVCTVMTELESGK